MGKAMVHPGGAGDIDQQGLAQIAFLNRVLEGDFLLLLRFQGRDGLQQASSHGIEHLDVRQGVIALVGHHDAVGYLGIDQIKAKSMIMEDACAGHFFEQAYIRGGGSLRHFNIRNQH